MRSSAFVLLLFFVVLCTPPDAWCKVIRQYTGKINVNDAPAAEIARLPGIGDVAAFRIVKEREKSGRFAAVDDLRRVKGVSSRVLEMVRPHVALEGESNLRVLIDLNSVTVPLLLGLPGMSEGQARSIVSYRKREGSYASVSDLLKVPGIDAARLKELSEWLTVAEER